MAYDYYTTVDCNHSVEALSPIRDCKQKASRWQSSIVGVLMFHIRKRIVNCSTCHQQLFKSFMADEMRNYWCGFEFLLQRRGWWSLVENLMSTERWFLEISLLIINFSNGNFWSRSENPKAAVVGNDLSIGWKIHRKL